ncbi:MAG: peptidoglycan editing factor PgeF [Treponema sp.]|jgi:YfiH family protein|nr:peptidoglycan editing factor PgeF [Treponema sp.]
MNLYPFSVHFFDDVARFPFCFEGKPLDRPFCALSSRSLGNVLEREDGKYPVREAFYKSQGYKPAQCFACTQVHSRKVLLIDETTPNNYPEGDGLITMEPHIALSVTVADCLPVFLYDTKSGATGILHSGWKGTGIVKVAIEMMNHSFGSEAKNIAAVLGPCIQACCYQVDEERANQFEAEFGSLKSSYPLGSVTKRVKAPDENRDLCYLNLQAANAALLEEAGVEHLAYTKDCTFMDERFGSFRREGKTYTRMAALVGKV